MERELPTITIEGTAFLVDVANSALREKGRETNIIRFDDMRHSDNQYSFDYDLKEKNIPSLWSHNKTSVVSIPEQVVLDPDGLARKYKLSLEEVKGKTDFEIMVDPVAYDLRVNRGILPTIEIAGHLFYVDLQMDKLRPKDDFLSRGIVFSDIENYYDEDKRRYTIPYNPKTHEFQEPDYRTIRELPKDLIAVRFSSERLLDRIGWNRKYGFEITHGLAKNGLKLQFEARQVAWKKTFLVDLIKSNLKTKPHIQKPAEKEQPEQPNKNISKGRKM
jgi:hypothetical protein